MNRLRLLLYILSLLGIFTCNVRSQDTTSINLAGKAAFRAGDDEVWRSKYIDEREGWNFINIPSAWERQGFSLLNGFAWYHVRFRIPRSMKNDSLLLVMSAVDDADETFLNGVMVGKTGSFPPQPRSELRSLRVYPLPRDIREDYNLLAVRVYDQADSGGITGSIFRIIRADSMMSVLNEIVDDPFKTPNLYLTNGVMVSSFNPKTSSIEWSKPHIFNELENGLQTDIILSSLTLSIEIDGSMKALSELKAEKSGYVKQSGIIQASYSDGLEVSWYHPHSTRSRILVVMAQTPRKSAIDDIGIITTFPKSSWVIKEFTQNDALKRRKYFVLAFNSCCDELAQKDLSEFLAMKSGNHEPYALEAEESYWKLIQDKMFFFPATVTEAERAVYRQSVSVLLQAQSREIGLSEGQIVSAFEPPSHAYAIPRDHLRACLALSEAGNLEQAQLGLDFIRKTTTGMYTFFPLDGTEYGIGFPHLVSPSRYYGDGSERVWPRPEDATLSVDGMALYIEAFEALRKNTKRKIEQVSKPFSDSAFVAPQWKELSVRVADVLMYVRDSAGLIPHDGSPWGKGLTQKPSIYASLHAAAALRIGARYARLMHEKIKAFLYEQAAEQTLATIKSLIDKTIARTTANEMSQEEQALFHPFLIDGIILGLFEPGSRYAQFALDILENSFRIEDKPSLYNAQPDGDWFTRQARPQITLRLARAYAINGNLERARELFSFVTKLAYNNNGMLPELVEPVSGNWYGGLPSIVSNAEYILTAEIIDN